MRRARPPSRPRSAHAAAWVMGVLVAGLGAWGAVVRSLEAGIIYQPTRPPAGRYEAPRMDGVRFEDVFLTTNDGTRIHAWHLPAEDARGTVLFLHGNAGNLSDRYHWLRAMNGLGMDVLAIDYRGYGKSAGTPDEAGLYEDAETAYLHLLENRRVRPETLVVYGTSLGGGPACDLASRFPCAGLVLQSTFSSLPDVAETMVPLPTGPFMANRFDNLEKIAAVEAPKLFIHSRTDEVIPYDLGKRLYDEARVPKRLVTLDKVGHNDVLFRSRSQVMEELQTFFAYALGEDGRRATFD